MAEESRIADNCHGLLLDLCLRPGRHQFSTELTQAEMGLESCGLGDFTIGLRVDVVFTTVVYLFITMV